MNHKPGSVIKNLWFLVLPSVLGRPCGWSLCSLPAALLDGPPCCCLTLLLMWLAIPAMLPLPRWALTPPFHPSRFQTEPKNGGMFSVALSVSFRITINYADKARVLPGIMPCGARTFLPIQRLGSDAGQAAAWFIVNTYSS